MSVAARSARSAGHHRDTRGCRTPARGSRARYRRHSTRGAHASVVPARGPRDAGVIRPDHPERPKSGRTPDGRSSPGPLRGLPTPETYPPPQPSSSCLTSPSPARPLIPPPTWTPPPGRVMPGADGRPDLPSPPRDRPPARAPRPARRGRRRLGRARARARGARRADPRRVPRRRRPRRGRGPARARRARRSRHAGRRARSARARRRLNARRGPNPPHVRSRYPGIGSADLGVHDGPISVSTMGRSRCPRYGDLGVHDAAISVSTMRRSRCPRWAHLGVHDAAIRAASTATSRSTGTTSRPSSPATRRTSTAASWSAPILATRGRSAERASRTPRCCTRCPEVRVRRASGGWRPARACRARASTASC